MTSGEGGRCSHRQQRRQQQVPGPHQLQQQLGEWLSRQNRAQATTAVWQERPAAQQQEATQTQQQTMPNTQGVRQTQVRLLPTMPQQQMGQLPQTGRQPAPQLQEQAAVLLS